MLFPNFRKTQGDRRTFAKDGRQGMTLRVFKMRRSVSTLQRQVKSCWRRNVLHHALERNHLLQVQKRNHLLQTGMRINLYLVFLQLVPIVPAWRYRSWHYETWASTMTTFSVRTMTLMSKSLSIQTFLRVCSMMIFAIGATVIWRRTWICTWLDFRASHSLLRDIRKGWTIRVAKLFITSFIT